MDSATTMLPDAQQLPFPVIALRADGTITAANTAATAWAARDLVGTHVDGLFTKPGRVLFHTRVLPSVRLSPRAQEVALTLVDGSGQEREALAYAIADGGPGLSLALLPLRQDRRTEQELLRVRHAADSAPGALFEYAWKPGAPGRFTYASDGLLALAGVTPAAVRTSDTALTERFHPEDLPGWLDARERSAATLGPWATQCRVRATDGQAWACHAWTARPRREADGTTVWHGFATDITRQRELEEAERVHAAARVAEAARREAEEFARAMLDAQPTLLGYWDARLILRFANKPYLDWLGRSRDDAIGRPMAELLGPVFVEAHGADIRRVLDGQVGTVAIEMTGPTGAPDHFLAHRIPHVREGRVEGYFLVAARVTELVLAQQRLEELNRQLADARDRAEAATRAKSAFLANTSHEIRTPMNAIIGLAHLMSRDTLDALQRDRLAKIDGAARHLLQIINDILDLSKIEAGRMVLEEVEFGLDALLAAAFDLVGQRAREKGIELVLDNAGAPARLRGDPTRLSQAIVNLLTNAVKFTDSGWVRLRIAPAGDDGARIGLRFEVTDTGCGIEPDRQGTLFNAFVQADASTTRHHGGTGLGLALTRHLAQLMGGEVGLASTPGQGSRFWFSAWFGRAAESPVAAKELRLDGYRALLVDDLPESVAPLEDRLRQVGMQVDTLGDGRAAIARAEAELRAGRAYDVCLVDWRMAPLDGAATIRALRALHGTGAPACILVTAFDEPLMWQQARDAHCDAVLVKPITLSALQDALAGVLRARTPALQPQPLAGSGAELALRRDHAGARVLLAEDNPINLEVAVELLRSVGLAVETAVDGRQAVALAAARSHDLILMDMQMPHLDGLAAAREIRGRLGLAVPIVAMTANAFGEDRAACLAAGMNDHVAKPVDPEHLYATLLRWLPRPAPSVAPAAASTLEERLAAIAGFDLALALRNLHGSLGHLERVLRTFVKAYGAGVPALRETTTPEQRRDGLRACHSLRGACATLGMTAFVQQLADFESALARPDAGAHLAPLGARIDDALIALAAAFDAALA